MSDTSNDRQVEFKKETPQTYSHSFDILDCSSRYCFARSANASVVGATCVRRRIGSEFLELRLHSVLPALGFHAMEGLRQE